jgi:AhpD family alkylhydroperoxidase
MARLPLLAESAAAEEVRTALAAMPPQGTVYRMLAHAQTAFLPILHTVGAIQGTLALDGRLRELVILRVASRDRCDYELVQHEVVASIEGVPEQQVAALRAGRASGAEFDDREELLLRFVDEVLENVGATEATVAEMKRTFSDREIIETLVIVGQYHGLAMMLLTTALEPQPPLDPEAIKQARARRAALGQK